MNMTAPKSLIAGRLRTPGRSEAADVSAAARSAGAVRRELGPDAAEWKAVREAAADGRSIQERTVDCVVDRLLRELSW